MFIMIICILAMPLIIGLFLFQRKPSDDLTRLAAWLTLKPFVATPLCALVLVATGGSAQPAPLLGVFAIAPGVILTMILVAAYSELIFGPSASLAAWVLLALDVARWGSTLTALLTVNVPPTSPLFNLASMAWPAAAAMPVVFAIASFVIVGASRPLPTKRKRKRKPAADQDAPADEIVEI